jgi:hypothetical protein
MPVLVIFLVCVLLLSLCICLSLCLSLSLRISLKGIAMFVTNLVTPKASSKFELLFNKLAPEHDLLIKSLSLAAALGVAKLRTIIAMNLIPTCHASQV